MSSNNKRFLLATAAMLLPTIMFAATSDNEDNIGGYNLTLVCLVSLMFVLLFVIGMLANTLRQLGFVIKDKVHKAKSGNSGVIQFVIMLLAFSITALDVFAGDSTDKAATTAVIHIHGIPENDFYITMSMILLEIGVIFALVIYIKILLRAICNKPELVPAAEKNILPDHNYVGMQELGNNVPS